NDKKQKTKNTIVSADGALARPPMTTAGAAPTDSTNLKNDKKQKTKNTIVSADGALARPPMTTAGAAPTDSTNLKARE
ncbi:unnamed protein product, partial [Pylaiella littoralis]